MKEKKRTEETGCPRLVYLSALKTAMVLLRCKKNYRIAASRWCGHSDDFFLKTRFSAAAERWWISGLPDDLVEICKTINTNISNRVNNKTNIRRHGQFYKPYATKHTTIINQ